jgi:hypothetical protein
MSLLALDGTEISISPRYGSVNSGAKRHRCPPPGQGVEGRQDLSISLIHLLRPPVHICSDEKENVVWKRCLDDVGGFSLVVMVMDPTGTGSFTGSDRRGG